MGRLLAAGAVVCAALIAVLIVNGEGPNRPEEPDAAPAQTQPETRPEKPADDIAPSGSATGGVRVRMDDLRFIPESVSVTEGEAVRFVNVDDVAHTVYEDLGATSGKSTLLDSARIQPGQTFTYRPAADGVVAFVCTLHPTVMQGQILVEPDAA